MGGFVLVALLIVGGMMWQSGENAKLAAAAQSQNVPAPTINPSVSGSQQTVACNPNFAVALNYGVVDLAQSGTIIGGTGFVKEGNGGWLPFTTGSTLQAGSSFQFYTGDNTTYYGHFEADTVPCVGPFSRTYSRALISPPNFVSVKNNDGSTINGPQTAQPIAKGQTVTYYLLIEANTTYGYTTNPEIKESPTDTTGGLFYLSVIGNGTTTCYDAAGFDVPGCEKVGYTLATAPGYVASFLCKGSQYNWGNNVYQLKVRGNLACSAGPNENLTARFDDVTYYLDNLRNIKYGAVDQNSVDVGQAAQFTPLYAS